MLVAILLVALGTILAVAVAYESAMSARRGTATFSFDEALLVGEGAEALAAYGLRAVVQSSASGSATAAGTSNTGTGGTGTTTTGGISNAGSSGLQNGSASAGAGDIYPAQPWAQPVGPLEVVPGVMLEASLEDMQGRFNLNWLVSTGGGQTGATVPTGNNSATANSGTALSNGTTQSSPANGVTNPAMPGAGQPDPVAVAAFNHLCELVGIEPKWADLIVDWIDSGSDPLPDGAEDSAYLGQNPPYLTANQYITSPSELLALPGFGHDRYAKLAPYITALPPTTLLNICSAPGPVLDAFLTGRQEWSSDPNSLAKNRATAPGCFPSLANYQATFDSQGWAAASARFNTKSQYFRLTSLITIGTTEFNLYSLLYMDSQGPFIHPIQRSFSAD